MPAPGVGAAGHATFGGRRAAQRWEGVQRPGSWLLQLVATAGCYSWLLQLVATALRRRMLLGLGRGGAAAIVLHPRLALGGPWEWLGTATAPSRSYCWSLPGSRARGIGGPTGCRCC
jgi:hypothetical protein